MNLCPLMHHFTIVVLFLFHSYFRQRTWGWRSLHNSPFEHANNDFKIVSLVFLKICPWWEGGFSCQWCHLADEWGVQTQALCVWHDPASPNHSAVSPPSYPIHMSRSNFHKSPSSLLWLGQHESEIPGWQTVDIYTGLILWRYLDIWKNDNISMVVYVYLEIPIPSHLKHRPLCGQKRVRWPHLKIS